MDTLDFLNEIAGGAEAADAPEFRAHPIGDFHAVVVGVEEKHLPQSGNTVCELKLKTFDQDQKPVGQTSFTIWYFTAKDVEDAKTTQDGRDSMQGRIRRVKRLFTDLGVYDQNEVKLLIWSSKDSTKPSILNSFQMLQKKRCQVSIKTSFKDASKQVVFINAPSDTVTGAQGMTNGRLPAMSATSPASQSYTKAPGQDADLDRIPF